MYVDSNPKTKKALFARKFAAIVIGSMAGYLCALLLLLAFSH